MADSRYSSKLGPIPEDHFENDSPHDPELMHKRAGADFMAEMDRKTAEMKERIRQIRSKKSGDKPGPAKVSNNPDHDLG